MKNAIRGGHNLLATGASGIVNEVTEDRKILASVNKWLLIAKNEVLDVTPGRCASPEDLAFGVDKANTFKADIFSSIHLNAGGGKGVEVVYSGNSIKGKEYATSVCNSIAKLGFTNRGAKSDVRGLYELKHTEMPAIIIECFFCDSQIDVDLYRKLGSDAIGKAIAEGIVGHELVEVKVVNKKPYQERYVKEFQKFYNEVTATTTPLTVDGIYSDSTEKAYQILSRLIKGEY